MKDPVDYAEDVLKLAREAVAARVSRDGAWFFIAGKGDHFAAVQACCAVIVAERESCALRNIANTAEHAAAAVFLEQERCAGAASELTFDAHELAQASDYGRGMDHAARTILAAIRSTQPSPQRSMTYAPNV